MVLFSFWDGWYLRSADATWVYGWRPRAPSLLPLSLGVGRVMVRPDLPPLNSYVSGQWMAYHQNSPIASHGSVNCGVTIAFSQFGKVNRGVEGAGDFPEIDYRPGHEIGSVRMQGMRGSGGGAELGVSEVFSEEEMPRAVP